MPRRVLIMGAAGRDFHNFNVGYRDDPTVEAEIAIERRVPATADSELAKARQAFAEYGLERELAEVDICQAELELTRDDLPRATALAEAAQAAAERLTASDLGLRARAVLARVALTSKVLLAYRLVVASATTADGHSQDDADPHRKPKSSHSISPFIRQPAGSIAVLIEKRCSVGHFPPQISSTLFTRARVCGLQLLRHVSQRGRSLASRRETCPSRAEGPSSGRSRREWTRHPSRL